MANAIEATSAAYDYLTKPFDLEEVVSGRSRARVAALTRDLQRLRGELEQRHELVIGRTPAMQEVYKIIGRVAATDATVLIQGDTGTGKELVAKTLHYHSGRNGPFVALNCSAIPNELLESELFGYERGAFTGANERRIGKFEAAAGGTLFLDEIGELPLGLQVARVLQEREFASAAASHPRRCPHRRGDEPGPGSRGRRRPLPRGPLLPPERGPHHGAAAARPPRRHPELIDFFVDKVNGRSARRSSASRTRRATCSCTKPGRQRPRARTRCCAPRPTRLHAPPDDFTLSGSKPASGGSPGSRTPSPSVWDLLETQGTSGALYDTVLAAIGGR
jgi:hypothetical protein